ncbi:proto-oncogene tyrosine-protein kinase ROS-like isoform X1 [Monodelphis domestica]|uniref:proto-oncogene tyrosine-protein kinase ROS-like isoform X1 n=1 Tax=Monodelphis domestica TaxID=13616 RepID=UPI0024E1C171|nr:proto-oncogene tyrosine-protein kinase ROS-like isoform X1 [Monodelphis domestica]
METSISRIISVDLRLSSPVLQYYSGRLVWISQTDTIYSLDLANSRKTRINKGMDLTMLTAFVVVQPRPFPVDFFMKPDVIPQPLSRNSFHITGNSSAFCISWNLPGNVNHGNIYYLLKSLALSIVEDLDTPKYCLRDLPPFTEFDLSVKPYTYWRSAAETLLILHSPESEPSTPENPRIFVTISSNVSLNLTNSEVEVRWDPPSSPNGILQGYMVSYTLIDYIGVNRKTQE